jgi:SAM-dependent methyltransferase
MVFPDSSEESLFASVAGDKLDTRTRQFDVAERWPERGLERVLHCPVCAEANRLPLHIGLTDRAFFCGPGNWDLYRCTGCGCAYLDPRPTPDTIHLAYRSYYTHSPAPQIDTSKFGRLGRLRHALGNGYRNWRFGTKAEPATRIGVLVTCVTPGKRRFFEEQYRHLPRPKPGWRLLDVGFGDAVFLELARSAGWIAQGVDSDPVAVEAAAARGLDVRQGHIDSLTGMAGSFDAITMSHVIEHLHDPLRALESAFSLLKPGGRLWVETPNIDSYGHDRFGPDWRGLEPPRHLVMFNWHSMESSLRAAGFSSIHALTRHSVYNELAAKSNAIRQGKRPSDRDPPTLRERALAVVMRCASAVNHRRSEYITVMAFKPSAHGR